MSESRISVEQLLGKLKKTFVESGGQLDETQNMDELTKNLSVFDATKVLITKKLEKVREQLKKRDDIMEKHEGKSQRVIKLESDIRNMVKFIKNDLDKLIQIHKASLRKKNKITEEENREIQQQEIDIHLVTQHVKEVEGMFRKRTESLIEGKKVKFDDMSTIFSEIPDNPLESALPKIDVTNSLIKVRSVHHQIEQGVFEFGIKVDKLKEITMETTSELDDHRKLLEGIDDKTQNEHTKIELMTKKINDANEQIHSSFRMTVGFICLLVILIIFFVIVLYISLTIYLHI